MKRTGLLDTTEFPDLDYYLVLTGPPSPAGSSRGISRPWCIQAVFLFDARQVRSGQVARGVRSGIASSVVRKHWDAAEIYPRPVIPADTSCTRLRAARALPTNVSATATPPARLTVTSATTQLLNLADAPRRRDTYSGSSAAGSCDPACAALISPGAVPAACNRTRPTSHGRVIIKPAAGSSPT